MYSSIYKNKYIACFIYILTETYFTHTTIYMIIYHLIYLYLIIATQCILILPPERN